MAFSLERTADPATDSHTAATYLGDIVGVKEKLAGNVRHISGIRVVDDHTLEIRFDGLKAYFLAKMTYSGAMVVDRENVATNDEWYRQSNGTGPFKLRAWEEGQRIILEHNQGCYREAPRVKQVVLRFLAVCRCAYTNRMK